jgi:hypothetical protein
MFGVGFLVRLLQAAVAILVAAGLITGFFFLITWVFRLMWEAFETNFEMQAEWIKEKAITYRYKLPLPRFGKIGCAVFSVTVMMLCLFGFIAFAYLSGQSSGGEIIP